jgi:hypothetical protein
MKSAILLFAAALFSTSHCCADDTPLACNLGALTAAERHEHTALTGKLFAAVTKRSDIRGGYAFQLDRKRVSVAEVGQWVALEKRCCPFFDFRFQFDRNGGPMTLSLSGRDGVRKFIVAELGLTDAKR